MKRAGLICCLAILAASGFTQRIHIGVFAGVSAYNGDLTTTVLPRKVTNGAIGITGNYEITDQLIARAGFTYTVVGGADRFSGREDLNLRNLSFETNLVEFSAVGEYYLFNLYERSYSPYFFAGLALFHYDPYAYYNRQKVYLRPLSTEGQGVTGYPDRKAYSLTQLAVPFGGGIKFAVSENLRVGLEVGLRKLFTDYLDDVSKNYVDPNELYAARGQLAVDVSYRGDEIVGGFPSYPQKTVQRGNFKNKDAYYLIGLHVTYKLGGGNNGGGLFGGKGRAGKSRNGCPANPL